MAEVVMRLVVLGGFVAILWLTYAAGSRRKTPAPWLPIGGGGPTEEPPKDPRQT